MKMCDASYRRATSSFHINQLDDDDDSKRFPTNLRATETQTNELKHETLHVAADCQFSMVPLVQSAVWLSAGIKHITGRSSKISAIKSVRPI